MARGGKGALRAEGSAFELIARKSTAFVSIAGATNDRRAHQDPCECWSLKGEGGCERIPLAERRLHGGRSGHLLRLALRSLANRLLGRLLRGGLLRGLALRGLTDRLLRNLLRRLLRSLLN